MAGSQRGNVNLRIDAEDAEAVRAFLKVTTAERNLEVQTRRTNAAMKSKEIQSKKNTEGLLKMGRSAGAAVAGMAGFAGVTGTLNMVYREIERVNEALIASSKRANEASGSLRSWVQIQAGPEGDKLIRETILAGANRGLTPNQVGQVAQPLQSLADKDGSGTLDAEERKAFDNYFAAAAGMAELGVDSADALKVIGSGAARGLTGQESADKLLAAADASFQDPKALAKAIAETGEFSSLEEALAVLTATTIENQEPGTFGTSMKRLGLILGKAGEQSKEGAAFNKKFGLEGLSESEKLTALAKYGARTGKGATEEERIRDFTAGLSNEEGITKEASVDLARAVRAAWKAESTRAMLDSQSEGWMERSLQKQLDNPLTGPGILSDRQKALAEAGGLLGPQAEEAQRLLAERQIEGAGMLAKGDVANVTPEGEAAPLSQRTWGAWIRGAGSAVLEAMGPGASVGYGYAPGAAAWDAMEAAKPAPVEAADVLQAQRELTEALKANTEATRANSGAAQRVAPVGGNPANAEEKY